MTELSVSQSGPSSSQAPTREALSTVQNGPELWSAILDPIRSVFGSGVVAGGAVRDYLLDFVPRDIDVFVNVDSREELEAGIGALGAAFSMALMTPENLAEYETAPDWKYEVRGVLDGMYVAEPPSPENMWDGSFHVQIVARPMADFGGPVLCERFDLGITRCWFDGEIHDTPAAAQDRAAQTLTLMRWDTEAHVQRSVDRASRFRGRYPGFRFVDPRPPATPDAAVLAANGGLTPREPRDEPKSDDQEDAEEAAALFLESGE